jgi:predicted enzyme related to lactoylglutathione lyase
MGEICDFVPLSAVAETAKPFAHFRRFEGERQSRPIHFEIPADNIDRCSKFYSDVFGWKVTKWPMGNSTYSLCDTGDPSVTGIDGGIVSRESLKTVMNTQYVEDFEAACKRIEKAGGKATRGMAIPGVGMYAPCYDTEGNLFGILQPEM